MPIFRGYTVYSGFRIFLASSDFCHIFSYYHDYCLYGFLGVTIGLKKVLYIISCINCLQLKYSINRYLLTSYYQSETA